MARIRSIHPGLWTDERFVSVSRDAGLFYIGILNQCDDQGVFAWKPLTLKMQIFPAAAVTIGTIGEWLQELMGADLICQFSVDGKIYAAVRNFCRWQNPKKPNRTHPLPPEFRTYVGSRSVGSEPEGDDGGDGVELCDGDAVHSPEPVPNQSGTPPPSPDPSPGKSAQREEGVGEGERKKGSELRSGAEPAPTRTARDDLWQHGLPIVRQMTGQSERQARAFVGKLLSNCRDDCAVLLSKINEARDLRPVDPGAWLAAACQQRSPPGKLAHLAPAFGLDRPMAPAFDLDIRPEPPS